MLLLDKCRLITERANDRITDQIRDFLWIIIASGQRILIRGRIAGEDFFQWENLMWHSTASAGGQWGRRSTTCREITTLSLSKVSPYVGDLTDSSLGQPEFTPRTASRSVRTFLQGLRSSQTDRQTGRPIDHVTRSVAIGCMRFKTQYFGVAHKCDVSIASSILRSCTGT